MVVTGLKHRGCFGFGPLHISFANQDLEAVQQIRCSGPCSLCVPPSGPKTEHDAWLRALPWGTLLFQYNQRRVGVSM